MATSEPATHNSTAVVGDDPDQGLGNHALFMLGALAMVAAALCIIVSLQGRKPQLPERIPQPLEIHVPADTLDFKRRRHRGNPNAPHTLVAFIDYECPFSTEFELQLKKVTIAFPELLKVFIWHNPLPMHQRAFAAATATEAAREQGKFWPFHELMLGTHDRLAQVNFREAARSLELNLAHFDSARHTTATASVRRDMETSKKLRIYTSPGMILLQSNGKSFRLWTIGQLIRHIESLKASAGRGDAYKQTSHPSNKEIRHRRDWTSR